MGDYFILDENMNPVEVSAIEWAQWFEMNDRQIVKTDIGNATISTVFLGSDHSFGRTLAPLLFETLVFGGSMADTMDRYATIEEARAGHEAIVEQVKEAQDKAHDEVLYVWTVGGKGREPSEFFTCIIHAMLQANDEQWHQLAGLYPDYADEVRRVKGEDGNPDPAEG